MVTALRWWLLYPLTGVGAGSGSPASALAWGAGASFTVAIMAGIGAGIGVESTRPNRWSLLMAVLIWLGHRTSVSRGAFPDVRKLATVEFCISGIAAVIAYASFHVSREHFLKRFAVASAR